MISLDTLKRNEEDVIKLRASIESNNGKQVIEKLRNQLRVCNYNQETAVMNYLEAQDQLYNSLAQENFDLLVNDHIEFVVTKEDWGLFKSHATKLNGSVHDNGFFYAQTTKTDLAIFNFQKGFYPLGYEGLVNYFGETDLIITKKGWRFFGSKVPQKYIGSIDSKGNILMKTTETYWETDGTIYVNRIIGDYFSGNGVKRSRFLDNMEKLKSKIVEFRSDRG